MIEFSFHFPIECSLIFMSFVCLIFAWIFYLFVMENGSQNGPKSIWESILLATFFEGRFFDTFWSSFVSFWLPLGSPLVPFWLPLAAFWFPLASFWLTFGALWLTFGALGITFAHPCARFSHFCGLLASFLIVFEIFDGDLM